MSSVVNTPIDPFHHHTPQSRLHAHQRPLAGRGIADITLVVIPCEGIYVELLNVPCGGLQVSWRKVLKWGFREGR